MRIFPRWFIFTDGSKSKSDLINRKTLISNPFTRQDQQPITERCKPYTPVKGL